MRKLTKEQQALYEKANRAVLEFQMGEDLSGFIVATKLRDMSNRARKNNEHAAAANYDGALEAFLRTRGLP